MKRQDGATKAEDKTINIAKATEPDLKSTPKPTSKPTYESVAPRGKKKPEITEPDDTTTVVGTKKKSKN